IIQQVMNQTGVSSRQALEAAKLAVKNNPNHELNLKEAIGQANLIKKQTSLVTVTPTPTPKPTPTLRPTLTPTLTPTPISPAFDQLRDIAGGLRGFDSP
ncbi:MAG: hypothetical protein Q8O55_11120, partial [Dehalococcoidales bacterium]|nr:hypothetical protein [Dehalococcoidales bacterium]